MTDIEIANKYVSKAKSSQVRGIDFTLTFTEYKRLLRTTKCWYTGMVLTKHDPNLPSHFTLDRIDASVGYTKINTVACSNYMNQKKRDLTLDDLKMLFKKLKHRL